MNKFLRALCIIPNKQFNQIINDINDLLDCDNVSSCVKNEGKYIEILTTNILITLKFLEFDNDKFEVKMVYKKQYSGEFHADKTVRIFFDPTSGNMRLVNNLVYRINPDYGIKPEKHEEFSTVIGDYCQKNKPPMKGRS